MTEAGKRWKEAAGGVTKGHKGTCRGNGDGDCSDGFMLKFNKLYTLSMNMCSLLYVYYYLNKAV